MGKTLQETRYRDIAIMLCKAMPIEGDDFRDKVSSYCESIKRMNKEQKNALRVAYIFSARVPYSEREDFFQDIALTILKARVKDEQLAYTIARCDWKDFFRKYAIRNHMSLNEPIPEDENGETCEFGELLQDNVNYAHEIDNRVDCSTLLAKFPKKIRDIAAKRVLGYALTSTERSTLNRWIIDKGHKFLMPVRNVLAS